MGHNPNRHQWAVHARGQASAVGRPKMEKMDVCLSPDFASLFACVDVYSLLRFGPALVSTSRARLLASPGVPALGACSAAPAAAGSAAAPGPEAAAAAAKAEAAAKAKAEAEVAALPAEPPKKKQKGGFGSFAGW